MGMDTLDSMWLSWHGRTHQTDFGDIGDQGGLKEIWMANDKSGKNSIMTGDLVITTIRPWW